MSLKAEEISNNWNELIKIIETEFSGERKDKLLNLYNKYHLFNKNIIKYIYSV